MILIKSVYKCFLWLVIFKISIFIIWYYTFHTIKSHSFDVVFINLDKNVNRARHMDKLLQFVGINSYRRFRAVDGKQLYGEKSYLKSFDQEGKSIRFNRKPNEKMKPGQTATWLSYLFLFKNFAASSSNRPLLLLEDDIDMEADFVKLLEDSVKEAPDDWDVLLCGYCCIEYFFNTSKILKLVKHFSALHCFMLRNSTVASRIANRIDLEVINEPIDIFLARMGRSNGLRIYARDSQLAVQRRDLFETNNPGSGKLAQEELNNSSIKLLSKFALMS